MVLAPIHPYTYYLRLKQRCEGFCLCKDSATYARSWEKDNEMHTCFSEGLLLFFGLVWFVFLQVDYTFSALGF